MSLPERAEPERFSPVSRIAGEWPEVLHWPLEIAVYERMDKGSVSELLDFAISETTGWKVHQFSSVGHLADKTESWVPHVVMMHSHGQERDPPNAPDELAARLRATRGSGNFGEGPLLVAFHNEGSLEDLHPYRSRHPRTFDLWALIPFNPAQLIVSTAVSVWNYSRRASQARFGAVPLSMFSWNFFDEADGEWISIREAAGLPPTDWSIEREKLDMASYPILET